MFPNPTWAYTPEDAEVARTFTTYPWSVDASELSHELCGALAPMRYFLPDDLTRVNDSCDENVEEKADRGVFCPQRRRARAPFALDKSLDKIGPIVVMGIESRERRRRQRRRKATTSELIAIAVDVHLEQSLDVVASADVAVLSPSVWATEGAFTSEGGIVAEAIGNTSTSKWHCSALSAGDLSEDGHIFAKSHAGPRKNHSNGMTLSSLCMLFERDLRMGGTHQYHYSIVEGSVGAADGVGFVFDSRIRRTNIQRMRSIFLNKHGQVCLRNLDNIIKLPCALPKLSEGVSMFLTVDLDHANASFKMHDVCGKPCGAVDLSFASLLTDPAAAAIARSGFFCAIVTGSITVSLQ